LLLLILWTHLNSLCTAFLSIAGHYLCLGASCRSNSRPAAIGHLVQVVPMSMLLAGIYVPTLIGTLVDWQALSSNMVPAYHGNISATVEGVLAAGTSIDTREWMDCTKEVRLPPSVLSFTQANGVQRLNSAVRNYKLQMQLTKLVSTRSTKKHCSISFGQRNRQQ
jgi:hypothetical protein